MATLNEQDRAAMERAIAVIAENMGQPVDPDAIFAQVAADRKSGLLADSLSGSGPLYGASKTHPGMIERVLTNGQRDTGHFRDGHFMVVFSAPTEEQLIAAHAHSTKNKEEIAGSAICGCFHCQQFVPPTAIDEWADGGLTAICPHCAIDSVLGAESGFPMTRAFLEAMEAHWFGNEGS